MQGLLALKIPERLVALFDFCLVDESVSVDDPGCLCQENPHSEEYF